MSAYQVFLKNKKRSKLSSKDAAQRSHARRRFDERYDCHLTESIYNEMVWKIQHGEGRHLSKQTNRLSVYSVESPIGDVPVVYDKQRGNIVTFLTEDMVRTGEHYE